MLIAIVAQRYTLHQLHDEKRRSRLRRPRVQKLGYVRMVHHRDRLTLRIESRQYLLRLPSLDPNELQRHLAPHRLGLVRHPDRTHAPLANLLAQNVPPANLRTFSLRRCARTERKRGPRIEKDGRGIDRRTWLLPGHGLRMLQQKLLDLRTQQRLTRTHRIDVLRLFGRRPPLQGRFDNLVCRQ